MKWEMFYHTQLLLLYSLFVCARVWLQILQECPDQPESINDMEQFDEIETVGKSLLDRLTVPVVYPDGYVTSPYDMIILKLGNL